MLFTTPLFRLFSKDKKESDIAIKVYMYNKLSTSQSISKQIYLTRIVTTLKNVSKWVYKNSVKFDFAKFEAIYYLHK